MKKVERPRQLVSPHIFASNILGREGLKTKARWHYFDDLMPWGWQVKAYKIQRRKCLLKIFGKERRLVLDVWPGHFLLSTNSFRDGHITVFDTDFKDLAVKLAESIETQYDNTITVLIP